jgi:hypothetical protein
MQNHGEGMEILTDPQRGMGQARDVLSGLFRQILHDTNVNPMKWHRLMEGFMNNPRHMLAARGRSRSSLRGNMRKALLNTTMSWKMFERGIYFLGPVRARFMTILTWPDGRETVHERTINLEEVGIEAANFGDDDTEE